ncbi:MAG: hypothetical protein D6811_12575 [Alphaproteobacteria bacterium]|nr:MAG: hypothetical protein D6811_12575 [Alphaproteobacteria bacterium]
MRSRAKEQLRALTRLAGLLRDTALAEHARAQARLATIADELAALERQIDSCATAWASQEDDRSPDPLAALAAEHHRQWCAARIAALRKQFEEAESLCALTRQSAARAQGRAEVLGKLARQPHHRARG